MATQRSRLVIVDDEPDYAGTLALALRAEGFETVSFSDARAALERISEDIVDPPDMLITDIVMPGMSGEELIASARRLAPDIPILAMTAYGDKHLVVRLLRAGCNDYIEKPFTTDEILTHINSLLTRPSALGTAGDDDPQVREHMAEIGKNLTGFVHDMNNQLAAMSGFRDMVEDGLEDPRRQEYCKAIKKCIFRLGAMAHGVMSAAGAGSSHLATSEQIEIREMLTDILDLTNFRARVNLMVDPRCVVWGHRARLEMVFWNLMKNADEALIGRKDGSITVACKRESDFVSLSVSDNGPGISDAIRGKLFQVGQTFGKRKGNGLGLFSVRRAVEAMGGTVQAESIPGAGATFSVRLPVSQEPSVANACGATPHCAAA